MDATETPTTVLLTSRQRLTSGSIALLVSIITVSLIFPTENTPIVSILIGMTVLAIALYYLLRAAIGYNFMEIPEGPGIPAPSAQKTTVT